MISRVPSVASGCLSSLSLGQSRSRQRRPRSDSPYSSHINHSNAQIFYGTARAMRASTRNRPAATFTQVLWRGCLRNAERWGTFHGPLVVLSQPRGEWRIWSAYCFPEFARDPLSDRCNGTTPYRRGLCQSRHELGSKPTISVSFLDEPTAAQVLARDQIKHIRVNLSANWLED